MNNVTVIQINLDSITKELHKALNNSNCTFTLWDNYQDQLLLNIGNDIDYVHDIVKNDLSSKNDRIMMSKYSTYTSDITETNWKCVFVYDNTSLRKITSIQILYLLTISITVLFLAAALVSYKNAKKIYSPISNIMNMLSSSDSKTDILAQDYDKYSEFKFITETLNNMIKNKNSMQSELLKSIEQLNAAREFALRSQITPHFIYNTLEIIYLEAYKHFGDENIICDMLSSLSDIIRITFRSDKKIISISNELLHVEKYIHIQQIRFEDTFNVEWDIDPNLREYLTTKIILQPIVENSIVHGIIPSDRQCTIKITLKDLGDKICFIIEDDGIGMSPDTLRKINISLDNISDLPDNHIGILNVNMRIKIIWGNMYGCSVQSVPGKGTKVKLLLPKISPDDISPST